VFPTNKEQLSFWTTYHDEDLSKGGRERAYSSPDPMDAGGLRATFAFYAQTRRLRRVALGALYRFILVDAPQFDDRFDRAWYAWLRVTGDLRPGPSVMGRLKYSAVNTVDIPMRSSSTRYCEDEDSGSGTMGLPVPAECRGERFWEMTLQATQRLWVSSWVKLRVAWTHYTDRRERWNPVPTPTVPEPIIPKRDDVLIKGTIQITFS
jgi:hypothetical protein